METTNEFLAQNPTIGQLVTSDWRKAEVFKKYGIDFCCGGKKTVEEVCLEKGINAVFVESDLNEIDGRAELPFNFNAWDLDFLADYIVNNHHKYVQESIPFLTEVMAKVAMVHGDNHEELVEVKENVDELINELTVHMQKEEFILFPYIKQLVSATRYHTPLTPPPFGTIVNPISMMESEHSAAGDVLKNLETLTNNFTPPEDGCTSYRVVYAKLKEFQNDLHQHIHLENNILFPKAIKLEKELFLKNA
jgi:regulator of cell morphogenesis and NO signaling